MIHVVADLLRALADREAEALAAYDIDHPLTIGAMYEGLTAKLLSAALPEALDVRVVSGFVAAGTGKISPEIDCMVVRGEGELIPNTSKYKWPVRDLIAVVEVKKTLYSDGIVDAYTNLRGVLGTFSAHIQDPSQYGDPVDVTPVYDALFSITGIEVGSWEEVQQLPAPVKLVFSTLLSEFVSPVRVMLGYQGFSSEHNFRMAFAKFLEARLTTRGYGVLGLPQLSVSNGYSLVKLNGQPIYMPFEEDEWWPVLASSKDNPLRFLLALLWARIENFMGVPMPWHTLEVERTLTPFIRAKAVEIDGQAAWNFKGSRLQP